MNLILSCRAAALKDAQAGQHSFFFLSFFFLSFFRGKPVLKVLPVGTRIDRYGDEKGTFFAPEGTPYWRRGLPEWDPAQAPYNVYEVARPITVLSGTSAPWFGQISGGTQYKFPLYVYQSLEQGYLKKVWRHDKAGISRRSSYVGD